MNSLSHRQNPLLIVFVLAGLCCASGCVLLFPETKQAAPVKSPLKPLVDSREAIALEVYFVDRRAGDPLIGDTLWESLHSVTSIDPETRERLENDGFRIGMSAARPSRPLQVLMALSDSQDPTRRAIVQPYMIPSGQETWVVSRNVDENSVVQRQPLEGPSQSITVGQGQAIFKVQASHVEDGWARLVIIPEIQHGKSSLKPTATDSEWTFRDRRQAITLFEDRFAAELNLGEILVIGMHDGGKDKVAGHFLKGDSMGDIERLMMIRIADMRTIDPQRVDPETLR